MIYLTGKPCLVGGELHNESKIDPLKKRRKEIFHDEGIGFERKFSKEREHGDSFETSFDRSRIRGGRSRNSGTDGL
jgi:hypothetical protein